MSRDIKFRFWSRHLGKFVTPDDSIFVGALKDPDMNPMQYTGLKDKNGVEIYEGDIVLVTSAVKDRNYEVTWNEKGYWELKSHVMTMYCPIWEPRNPRVIGNIYEAPGLVEQDGAVANTSAKSEQATLTERNQ